MTGSYILSFANSTDYDDLSDVMFDAVRHGPSQYSQAQRAQWVPERRSGEGWKSRLDQQAIVVARNSTGAIGFMSVDSSGYVDFAYIRPAAQGTGLFRLLFTNIEQFCIKRGTKRLWVHASLMAQPAFAAMGFTVVAHQVVGIGSETFQRAEMEKPLVMANIKPAVEAKLGDAPFPE